MSAATYSIFEAHEFGCSQLDKHTISLTTKTSGTYHMITGSLEVSASYNY